MGKNKSGTLSSAELAQSIFSKASEGRKLAEKKKRQIARERARANAFRFTALPFDIQEMVLRYLPAAEIGRCCSVSKTWGHIYQGAVASIYAQVVGVARGRSRMMRHAELQLLHRLRNTDRKETAIEMALWGCFNGHDEYVLGLLEERSSVINVNTCGPGDWDGATCIHVACRQGNLKMVRALLDRKADPACLTKSKQTPLILACDYGFPDIVELLLKQSSIKCNVNWQDSAGRSALFAACEKGHIEVVDALVDWAEMKHQETGEADMPLDIDLGTVEKGSPLCVACRTGQGKIAARLLRSTAHVNAVTEDGRTALFCAVERGALQTTRTMLAKRPPVTAKEMAEMFYRESPHHGMAAAEQKAETETLMIDTHPGSAGALVDFANNSGKTPLYSAAERGNVNLLQVLLDARANPNKPTFLNKTPLYAATENGHTEVVKLLLKHSTRAHVLHQTNFGTTAVFMAQRNGHMAIKALLSEFCIERLSEEKAKKRKSRRKQGDAINRLVMKKSKGGFSAQENKPSTAGGLVAAQAQREQEKRKQALLQKQATLESKRVMIDSDIEQSQQTVTEAIKGVSVLEHLANAEHELQRKGKKSTRPVPETKALHEFAEQLESTGPMSNAEQEEEHEQLQQQQLQENEKEQDQDQDQEEPRNIQVPASDVQPEDGDEQKADDDIQQDHLPGSTIEMPRSDSSASSQSCDSGPALEEDVKSAENEEKKSDVSTTSNATQQQQPKSQADLRRERAKFFAQRFKRQQQQEESKFAHSDTALPLEPKVIACETSINSGRLVPKKEKEVLAARKWSQAQPVDDASESGRADSRNSLLSGEECLPSGVQAREREGSDRSLDISEIRTSLMAFSSTTTSYKMTHEIFEKSFAGNVGKAEPIFELMRGSKVEANAWDVFVASTLASSGSKKEKLSFCFGLFDAKNEGRLDAAVSKTMLRCCCKAIRKLKRGNNVAVSKSDLEQAVGNMYAACRDQSQMSRNEFVEWAQNSKPGQMIFGPVIG